MQITGPGGLERHGFAGWAEHYSVWHTASSDNVITVASVVGEGDRVMGEAIFTGTHDGVLRTFDGEVPPSGKSLRLRYVVSLQVAAGKIISHTLYYDRAGLMEQLGLLPAVPAA